MTNIEELEIRIRNYWQSKFDNEYKVEILFEDVFINAINECILNSLFDMGYETFHIYSPEDLVFCTRVTFPNCGVVIAWDLESAIDEVGNFDIRHFHLEDKGFNSLHSHIVWAK